MNVPIAGLRCWFPILAVVFSTLTGFYFSMHHPYISFYLSVAFALIVADYAVACVALRVSSNSQDLHHTLSSIRDIILSASAAMIILLYFRLSRLKSLPYPWEKPQPSALTMALISSLERTRSVVCFSTFRIFGLSDISIGPDYLLLSAICQSLRRALRFGLCTNNNPTSRLTWNSRYKRAFAHFSRD